MTTAVRSLLGIAMLGSLASTALGFERLYPIWNEPLSTELFEDFEPVLEALGKRIRKEVIAFGHDFIFDEKIGPECLQSYARIMSGVPELQLWALRFFDSSGVIAPGAIDGRMVAQGNYDECLSIRVPNRDEPTKVDFNGRYCTINIRMERQPMIRRLAPVVVRSDPYLMHYVGRNMTWLLNFIDRVPLGYRMGLCLPSTCAEDLVPYFVNKLGGKYGVSAEVLGCRDPLNEKPVPEGTFTAVIVIAVMASLVAVATFVDFFVTLDNKGAISVMQCFSARTAYLKLTNTETLPANLHLDCIHGIRVLSSFWVLLAHTYGGDPGNYDRPYHLFEKLQDPIFTVVTQSIFAVDSFYAITGILLYRTLRLEMSRFKSIGTLPFAILVLARRAVRLSVPAMGSLCFLYLTPLFVSGPPMDYLFGHFTDTCSKHWWHMLAFITNFWTFDDYCLIHSWYIAADMQMLCILVLPVMLMVARPRQGLFIIGTLGIASVVYAGALLVIYDTAPTILILPVYLAKSILFSTYQHVSPLAHMSVMCVGIAGGYFIETHREVKVRRSLFVLGWIVCFLLTSVIIFVPLLWHISAEVGFAESLVYVMLSRPCWALCIVWIVFACSVGQGEPFRTLFNRPNVIILGRLSYCFYLVSGELILVKIFATRHVVPFTHFQNARDFFADMVFSYLVAILLYILFEAPTYAVDKLLTSLSFSASTTKGDARHVAAADMNRCNGGTTIADDAADEKSLRSLKLRVTHEDKSQP